MLPKGLLKEYSHALSLLMRLLDMCAILAAGLIAYVYRFPGYHVARPYLMAMIIGTLSAPLIFSFFQIYTSVRGKGLINHFLTLIQAVLVMTLMLAGLAFFTKSGEVYSRLWFMQWMLLAAGCLILLRCSLLLFLCFMRSHGLNERRVVIFGAGKLGRKLADTVQQALWTGFRITSFIDDHATQKALCSIPIPVIQTPAHLSGYLMDHDIDEIWIALPLRAEERVKAILHELRHHTITTRFALDIFGLDLLNHSITDLAGFPVLNIRSTPMVGINRLIKAFEDRIIATIILFIISPLLILITIGIKCTSRGPVFFKQLRHGWDGKIIKVYKFRTMFLHEEKEGQITQASMNDKRVTPLGRFLRRTSLDELPQFINVLQGRMSIVGPRPHAIQHNEYYKDSIHTYMQRHRVKPGITGWAQINGWRGETDTLEKMQKRVDYDLFYINNWSLGFDLKIIFLTFFRGFINRNAY
jgi:putative colanic acid biosynthesis UDP-glucose lipid carrier transferase